MEKTKKIEIEILIEKESSLRNLLEIFSDAKMREWVYEYPSESLSLLKDILNCLPTNDKNYVAKQLAIANVFQRKALIILPDIMEYIKKEEIKFKKESYIKNFIPFVCRYIGLAPDYNQSEFRNAFIKTIDNFLLFIVLSDATQYQINKINGKICQLIGILDQDESESELINRVKNALNSKAIDIYQDQLNKMPIKIIDPDDPFGFEVFANPVV